MSVSAGSGRLAYVLLVGNDVKTWGLCRKDARSPEAAASRLRLWLAERDPDIIITEHPESDGRKGKRTRSILRELCQVAADQAALNIEVKRLRLYTSKYAEAAALARLYPTVASIVPAKRRPWESEPRGITIFEALSLAHQVLAKET